MATLVTPPPTTARGERFFLIGAIVMTIVLVFGFSLQLGLGRSSFAVPVYVHIHAFVFFGWTMLYLAQNVFAANGSLTLHRRLGWLALGWIPAMLVMGTFITVMAVRTDRTPFFFQPAYFLIMNPLTLYTFAGLAAAAIVKRRQTQWHRRLMYCGMAILTGPGFGRFVPVFLAMPYAAESLSLIILLFPLAGVIRDRRVMGYAHPAWWWGIGAIVAMMIAIRLITFSPVGLALYRTATAGSPGAAIAPLDFPPPPWAAAPKP